MSLKIIYENDNVLVIDKQSGITVFPEGNIKEKTIIDYIIEEKPEIKKVGSSPRYGTVHRLDKDTSGILIIAKNNRTLESLQGKFKERKVKKKYIALCVGKIKEDEGKIETLIGRSPKDRRKQKVYLKGDPKAKNKREAKTRFKVIKRFKDYTLLEVEIATGRKHQIRCHLSYMQHPIAKDKLYSFKNQPYPKDLKRQFLHSSYVKVNNKEFKSDLPEDLKKAIKSLEYEK